MSVAQAAFSLPCPELPADQLRSSPLQSLRVNPDTGSGLLLSAPLVTSPPPERSCLCACGSGTPGLCPSSPSPSHTHRALLLACPGGLPALPTASLPLPDAPSPWRAGLWPLVQPALASYPPPSAPFPLPTPRLAPRFLRFCLCPHRVPRRDICGQAPEGLLDLCKQSRSRPEVSSSDQKSDLNHKNRKSWTVNQFSNLGQFLDPGPLE